jgi:N-acetylmuramoyl-L-alanine amidase
LSNPFTPPILTKLYNGRQAIDIAMLTLVIGREAGNQPKEAMLGMGWSVRNRVTHPGWWGRDWESVIEAKWQYSSIVGLQTDPNLRKYPNLNFAPWEDALAVAETVYAGEGVDPTGGAVDYYDKSLDANPPAWATDGSLVHACDLGSFHFFKSA